MKCYFKKTDTFEEVPLDKISLDVGLGVHGLEFLQATERDAVKYGFAWGAERINEKIYLTSWCVASKDTL